MEKINLSNISLDDNVKTTIRAFYDSVLNLTEHKIIRSSKYSADIAEFLCSKFFNLTLCVNQRQIGFDAVDKNKKKIQIKINNSTRQTNQPIGDKSKYDFLMLVVTSNSLLFNEKYKGAFLVVYKIPVSKIKSENTYITKTFISTLLPELKLDEHFNRITT
jgi:hypothetical protein